MEQSVVKLLAQVARKAQQRQMYTYRPSGHPDTLIDGQLWKKMGWQKWSEKPWQLDFHNEGKLNQERIIISANRTGKTNSGAMECAFHLTGDYPDWWKGRRFKRPVLVWTGSPTNETSRDIVQKALLGGTDKETLGTGTVPREKIIGKPKTKQAGVSDVVDSFKVRHISGGVSTCIMKTYEQGWRKWQGTEPEVVWMDEEPEDNEVQGKIRTEALTRLLTSNGIMMVTFTPLLGTTAMVEHFMDGGEGIHVTVSTWDDCPHLDKKARDRLKDSYPAHEVDARTKGVPMMGEGRVFTTSEDEIKVKPFDIPPHFARLKGIDFGIDHPAAVVDIAWDRDKDIIYVTRAKKKKGMLASAHIDMINAVDPWVRVAWPHDGTNREKSNGKKLKVNYANGGAKMLSRSACYDNDKLGAQPVEPILDTVITRIDDGEFKVFSTCHEFFDEYRNYHRKDGKLSQTRDDILKATFYAVMMKRYATTRKTRKQIAPTSLLRMS